MVPSCEPYHALVLAKRDTPVVVSTGQTLVLPFRMVSETPGKMRPSPYWIARMLARR